MGLTLDDGTDDSDDKGGTDDSDVTDGTDCRTMGLTVMTELTV